MINFDTNPILRKLANHLRQFVVDQHYEDYTPQDHAIWRFVMHQNFAFFKNTAYKAYIDGLKKTGLGLERIPEINEMNAILGKMGWAAATVDGFIPPAAFMEFQAYCVLPIAADIRQIEHVEYTPAPDIIHEAAGHAPIIADPEYAAYLKKFGEIGCRAISSALDYELYEAIRHLSILKELPSTPPEEIQTAENNLKVKQEAIKSESEMGYIRRLHWWTVEYGLIGDLKNPKIYGAGLLSSIGESASCLKPNVKKIPYSIDAKNVEFDITQPQPQLFVTPSFEHLEAILDEFASTMAFRTGGISGIRKAMESQNISTVQYSSGLQVSGKLTEFILDSHQGIAYLQWKGPMSLAFEFKELNGHGKTYHKDGFGSPVGYLNETPTPLEKFSQSQLKEVGIESNKSSTLLFSSGIAVQGVPTHFEYHGKTLLLITFKDCTVKHGDKILFQPQWGVYDMAVGAFIPSVFSGAADKDAYEEIAHISDHRTQKIKNTHQMETIYRIYHAIRECREQRANGDHLIGIWQQLKKMPPTDYDQLWLALLELAEISSGTHPRYDLPPNLHAEAIAMLHRISREQPSLSTCITHGLKTIP